MRKTTKKAVSVLLSILMVFSLLGALTLGVTAEEPCEHLYGTTGDARFTCVKCGEVVDRYTEVIPTTGEAEPEEPVDPDEPTAGPCPYCGETHNNKTIAGWWTELIHDLLFIIQRIAFWWM